MIHLRRRRPFWGFRGRGCRGLTMVELLVALALLSAITLGVSSWVSATARASTTVAEPVRWASAAEAALERIHDDVMVGDFDESDESAENRRVQVDGDILRIRTRSSWINDVSGVVIHEYVLDRISSELQLVQRADGGKEHRHLLVEQVDSWSAQLDEETSVLVVTIVSANGVTRERRYRTQ